MKSLTFIPGLQLCEGFFHDLVKPMLAEAFPGLVYSAGLTGSGSEVLGFDTEMSTDHHWGPRVMLFLSPADYETYSEPIRIFFTHHLPPVYKQYSTNFTAPSAEDKGIQLMECIPEGPVNHRIETMTAKAFFAEYLNLDIDREIDDLDWLTLPFQKLRSLTAGKWFHDGLELKKIFSRFTWYPHDIWLYLLAACWSRIGQDEHLMGRAGYAGDEIGSAVIGARLVRDIMHLAFLMEITYPPYAKWLGTAFAGLNCAQSLQPLLTKTLRACSWKERQKHLAKAYQFLVEQHNALALTPPLNNEVSLFWGRPFMVIRGEKIAATLVQYIKDEKIAIIARRRHIGNIDLFSDNTDFLSDPSLRLPVKGLYAIH